MSESIIIDKLLTKEEKYKQLLPQIRSLVEGEPDLTANLANICAALKYGMDGFFWAGFYFVQGEELVLGPFQGPVACTRIKMGGVCGKAVKEKRIVIVNDVNAFPGHIACNSDSKSEIVIPIYKGDKVFGVLDVDSETYSWFDSVDGKYLEEITNIITQLMKH